MNELCSTGEMVERLKDVLSKHITQNNVYDWHVADVLGLSCENLASMKSRNKVPFEEIILFCDRCGYPPMKIFMKDSESC